MNKKSMKAFLVAGIVFAIYVALAFLIPFERGGVFWVSLLFTVVAMVVCCLALYMGIFKKSDAKSKFYGFSIARVGLIYGAVQFAGSLAIMALAQWIELWLAGVVYIVAFGLAVIGLIGAESVVEEIQRQDAQLKRNVTVMRSLQSKLNKMVSLCTDAEAEKQVCALAEEIRYSDPVSSEVPADSSEGNATILDELQTEADLAAAIEDLNQAVAEGNREDIRILCRRASVLLAERNRLCKLNKG